MRTLAYCGLLLLVVAGVARGQQPVPGGQLPATTVQLPSFSFFTVNTTVSVPDRGGAYLGGVSRARDGSTTRGFGPLRNRGIGGDRVASGVSVQATIHNLDELDKAALAAAAAKRGAVDPDLAKAELIGRGVGKGIAADAGAARPADADLADSVPAIRAKNAAAAEARASEAAELLAKAEAAEAEGKASVAKIYYQMVARRDTGELKALAENRLAKLSGKTSAVAQR